MFFCIRTHIFVLASILLFACSNSEFMSSANNNPFVESIEDVAVLDYLPLDDSEYPYAGIPRIVIETEDYREIKDRETKIPAKFQIWGKRAPEGEVKNLTIRGRGNSSWLYMPKKSFKIEFFDKQEILGMPPNKDWALIANHIDKTLLRNLITHHLAATISASFTPKLTPVELFLNKEYMGVYLLSETIKIGSNRVNIPKTQHTYIVEFDEKYREDDIVTTTQNKRILNIHHPQNADSSTKTKLRHHINEIENYIFTSHLDIDSLKNYIDLDTYLKFYWIEELTKNNDGAFFTSVYFSWVDGFPLKMGPVWDFDQAYGNHSNAEVQTTDGWYIKKSYWNKFLFQDTLFARIARDAWFENHTFIETIIDSIESYKEILSPAAKNNFKRWKILSDHRTYNAWESQRYHSYEDAVNKLKDWIARRVQWIDKNL